MVPALLQASSLELQIEEGIVKMFGVPLAALPPVLLCGRDS